MNHTADLIFILRNAVIVLCVSFCSACTPPSETTLERIKKEGAVRVGYANEIPHAYVTPEGKLTGESIEMARKILTKMGINRIEGVHVEFGSLIPALRAGRIDMITAGMFILPGRCKQIAFSEPYDSIGSAFLVKAENPKSLHSYEGIAKNTDAVLCVIEGTAEAGYATAVGIPDSRILSVPDTPTGLEAVRKGRADALALTSLGIQNLIESANDPTIERARPFKDPIIDGKSVRGYSAFGFRKKDRAFLEEFNLHLKPFIGTKAFFETVRPFGVTDLPGNITAAELCEGH